MLLALTGWLRDRRERVERLRQADRRVRQAIGRDRARVTRAGRAALRQELRKLLAQEEDAQAALDNAIDRFDAAHAWWCQDVNYKARTTAELTVATARMSRVVTLRNRIADALAEVAR